MLQVGSICCKANENHHKVDLYPPDEKGEDFEYELDEKLDKFQTDLPDAIRTGTARIFWSNSMCNRMRKLKSRVRLYLFVSKAMRG